MNTAIADDVQARAEQVIEVVREQADTLAGSDQLPTEIVEASLAAGLYRLLLPAELGGLSVALPDAASVIERLSYADGSVGWCTAVANASGSLLAGIDEAHARVIAADPELLCVAGGFAAVGRGRLVDDEYELTGRWSFASGCTAATWLIGGMIAEGRSTPVIGFFPAEQAKIIRNWDVIGLRATGSHDVTVDAVPVPIGRTTPLMGGPRWSTDPVASLPFFTLGSILAAVSLGSARRALDELAELAATKIPFGRQQPLAEDPAFQGGFAGVLARLNAARGYLLDQQRLAWDAALSGDVTPAVAAGVSLATVETTAAALAAVQFAHQAAGTTSIRSQSTLARCLNDVLVATRHVAFSEASRQNVGKTFLQGAW